MYFLLGNVDFHCHVSLPEGTLTCDYFLGFCAPRAGDSQHVFFKGHKQSWRDGIGTGRGLEISRVGSLVVAGLTAKNLGFLGAEKLFFSNGLTAFEDDFLGKKQRKNE